ncbi:hypothetical protein ONZ45_g6588 [Pleurotus djamor]|nr:hypothetical protein ONZ45_g18742 [Pleurotus djamor]KAJ8516069.1 hypothetical protein ONZ45_g6588 [Pleurotus djamor]
MDTKNLASLHTSPYCTMSPNRAQQGLAVSYDCDASHNYNQGCGTRFSRDDSAGPGFNAAGGGRFAMMKSRDEGIKVWHWSNADPNIPTDVKSNFAYLEPNSWGPPEAHFPTSQECDYDSHFNSHQAIFDITLCGDWAGDSQAYTGANCPGSCTDYVDNHPEAFADAYWEIDSLLVYVPFFGPLQ